MGAALEDLVHETSTSTGTGNLTVAAVNGRRRGSDAFGTGDHGGDNPVMFIQNRDAAEWEVVPCYWSDADTMVRGEPIKSSNGGAAVDFSAGTKDITNDLDADRASAIAEKVESSPNPVAMAIAFGE